MNEGTVAQNEAEEVGRSQSERNEPLKGVLFSRGNLCFILFVSFIEVQLTYKIVRYLKFKVYIVVIGYKYTL